MIQTETTPNPDSLKFLSEKTLSTKGTEEFKKDKKNEIKIPFIKGIFISFFLSFLNSSVPLVDNVFSDKNFKESGLGVVSVCIIKALYYIKPTISRIFFRFSSAIILAFSVPFLKIFFKCDLSSSNF